MGLQYLRTDGTRSCDFVIQIWIEILKLFTPQIIDGYFLFLFRQFTINVV